jgi:pimeloyl-ACP methyl ester carboxylesterase
MDTITPVQNLTYGLLSNAAYKNGAVPPGWSIVDTSVQSMGPSDKGFAAVTFQNQITKEIVIAYRGTDEFGDAPNNFVQLALQNDVPGQLIEAQAYLDQTVKKFGPNLVVVGHSLGGALAQLISAFNETVSAFTYNAPGVYDIYKKELAIRSNGTIEPAAPESFSITNTNMSLDVISDVGNQMGTMINYPPSTLEGLKFFGAILGVCRT